MSKPIIAITPRYEKRHTWQRPGYQECITQAGGIPVHLSVNALGSSIEDIAHRFDGFLLSGGADIHPGAYGEELLPTCGELCPERDALEIPLAAAAIRLNKPVLGICRGFQVLNVALGGTLYQDLPTQLPGALPHDQPEPFEKPTHPVNVVKGSPLYQMIREERIQVNSMHHQGVRRLAEPLSAMAIAEDHLIEAFYMLDRDFVMGVQWHPEYLGMEDPASAKLICAFIRACEEQMERRP